MSAVRCAALCSLAFFLGQACAGPEGLASDAGDAETVDASVHPTDAGVAAPFAVSSSAFEADGTLPRDYTCDGAGRSPPLSWSGAPANTVEYALLMTTLARDGEKWNWVLHGIPAGTTGLAEGEKGVGTFGLTSDGPELAYSPPCSQGPGAKFYTFKLFALSERPALPADLRQVTGPLLAEAVAAVTLATAEMTVSYTRP